MAQPIPLDIPPRDDSRDLRSRLERAPDTHAEAVLAAYEVLQQLHDRGVLEIMRGALAASDDILQKVVDQARTPEAIRAIRNLLFWQQDRKSTRLNSSHVAISYAVFCLKKKQNKCIQFI